MGVKTGPTLAGVALREKAPNITTVTRGAECILEVYGERISSWKSAGAHVIRRIVA